MKIEEKQLCDLILNSKNLYQVCNSLGIYASGTNYDKLKEFIKAHNLNVEHFNSEQEHKQPQGKYPDDIVFCKNSAYKHTFSIRKRLLRDRLKKHQCERCGRTKWEGEPIPLEVHHINGNNKDNRLENLQMLCPNCHALTDTYCGRSKKKKLKIKKERPDTTPSKEDLIIAFKQYHSFLQVGNYFKVSDNCVRKWCKKRGLPIKTKEIKKFLNI